MVAANCVELTNVVGRFMPLTRTIAFAEKPLPMAVKEKLGLPAATVAGLIEVRI